MDGKVASLASMRLFDGWTLTEMRRLAKAADLVDLSPGESLVRDGAWHAGCFVLLSGAVVTTTADGTRLTSGVGEFIGLAETVADVAALGETVALRTSTVLAFSANGFVAALEGIGALRRLALATMAAAQVAPRRAPPVASGWALAPTS